MTSVFKPLKSAGSLILVGIMATMCLAAVAQSGGDRGVLTARRLVLQDSFQALEDEDGERYVHWARTDGRREGIPEAPMPQRQWTSGTIAGASRSTWRASTRDI